MQATAALWHLLDFTLPALFVGAWLALMGRWVGGKGAQTGFFKAFVLNSVLGLLILFAGLWWFGNDGKMLTYAALVVVCACGQWLAWFYLRKMG